MKFPSFTLLRPDTVAEVSARLRELGDDAKILAGGQSLLPLLAFRLANPAVLVDITQIPGLRGIDLRPSELRIGGLTTHRDVEISDLVAPEHLAIADGMAVLGHVSIRNMGTIGGSLAHCDPGAEWSALLVGLGGEVVASSDRRNRTIEGADLATGWFSSSLEPDEVISVVRFPRHTTPSASALTEVARRDGDFALCGSVVQLTAADSIIEQARVVAFGLTSVPRRLGSVEEALVGTPLSSNLMVVANGAPDALRAVDDMGMDDPKSRYCVERLLPALVGDALAKACERLVGSSVGAGKPGPQMLGGWN